jgi:hypothetical protein
LLTAPVSGFFKGTSADQDRRFSDKELKLLKSMKFPPEFDKKVRHWSIWPDECSFQTLFQVDLKKVNLNVIRPWIAKKVTELVGFEDEVVVEYAMGLLEDPNHTVIVFICSRFFSAYLYFFSDSRPEENANKPYRFPHIVDALVYDRSLVSPTGGSGTPSRRTKDVCG